MGFLARMDPQRRGYQLKPLKLLFGSNSLNPAFPPLLSSPSILLPIQTQTDGYFVQSEGGPLPGTLSQLYQGLQHPAHDPFSFSASSLLSSDDDDDEPNEPDLEGKLGAVRRYLSGRSATRWHEDPRNHLVVQKFGRWRRDRDYTSYIPADLRTPFRVYRHLVREHHLVVRPLGSDSYSVIRGARPYFNGLGRPVVRRGAPRSPLGVSRRGRATSALPRCRVQGVGDLARPHLAALAHARAGFAVSSFLRSSEPLLPYPPPEGVANMIWWYATPLQIRTTLHHAAMLPEAATLFAAGPSHRAEPETLVFAFWSEDPCPFLRVSDELPDLEVGSVPDGASPSGPPPPDDTGSDDSGFCPIGWVAENRVASCYGVIDLAQMVQVTNLFALPQTIIDVLKGDPAHRVHLFHPVDRAATESGCRLVGDYANPLSITCERILMAYCVSRRRGIMDRPGQYLYELEILRAAFLASVARGDRHFIVGAGAESGLVAEGQALEHNIKNLMLLLYCSDGPVWVPRSCALRYARIFRRVGFEDIGRSFQLPFHPPIESPMSLYRTLGHTAFTVPVPAGFSARNVPGILIMDDSYDAALMDYAERDATDRMGGPRVGHYADIMLDSRVLPDGDDVLDLD